jgi:hypothetical protein
MAYYEMVIVPNPNIVAQQKLTVEPILPVPPHRSHVSTPIDLDSCTTATNSIIASLIAAPLSVSFAVVMFEFQS